jgi:hypothetical protein
VVNWGNIEIYMTGSKDKDRALSAQCDYLTFQTMYEFFLNLSRVFHSLVEKLNYPCYHT